MEKYFEIVNGCKMYEDFFKWIDETEKIRKIYNDFSNTYGIEAEQFLPTKSRLFIVPTEKDKDKFFMDFTRDYGEKGLRQFRCNSDIGRYWRRAVADMPIPHKPHYLQYGFHLYDKYTERLFNVEKKLYGSICTQSNAFKLEDWMKEMKASDFFKIIESEEWNE